MKHPCFNFLLIPHDDYLTKDESLDFIIARLNALLQQRHRTLVRAARAGEVNSSATSPNPGARLQRGDLR